MSTHNRSLEKLLDRATVCALLAAFLIPAYYYSALPDQVPIHFNAGGIADSYSESMVWFMPVLGTLMCLGLYTLRKRFPSLNPRVKERESNISRKVLLIVGFLIALSFSYINIQIVFIALGKTETLGSWFLPSFVAAFLILPLLPLIKPRRAGK